MKNTEILVGTARWKLRRLLKASEQSYIEEKTLNRYRHQ